MDIPDDLHVALRKRAASEKTSIRSLVVKALESTYRRRRGVRLMGPPIPGKGKPGPKAPDRENPYDVLFS